MKLLFITHDASLTGAPKIALYILQWLKRNKNNVLVDTILLEGGELQDSFESLSHKTYYYDVIGNTKKPMNKWLVKVLNKMGRGPKTGRQEFFKEIMESNYDIIYANSVVSIRLASVIKSKLPKSKLILHVHELDNVIKMYVPNLKNYVHAVDACFAASNAVKHNLILKHDFSPESIDLVYAFSEIEQIPKTSNITKDFIVGGSGALNLRKGIDLFIQVAILIKRKIPDCTITFVWVGSTQDKNLLEMIKADLEKAGLKDIVHFTGIQELPIKYYKNFDVFLMTSREDPFPLVCVEMAHLEKPIICFENATGTEELIKEGGGFIVPYLDIEAMAERVMFYYENRTLVDEDGKFAKQLFSKLRPDIMCPLIFKKIESLF